MKVLLINAKLSLAKCLAQLPDVVVSLMSPLTATCSNPPQSSGLELRAYASGGKLSPRAALQVRRAIADFQPDVVHAFYGRALAHAILAVTGMRNRPRMVSFRGITSRLSRLDAGNWISYLHPLVDAHACESDAVRQALVASGIKAQHASVVYNSMSVLPTFRPGRDVVHHFGIPSSAFIIGTVATMRRVKGIDILLRTAIECADLQDVYWLLFGHIIDPEVRALAADPRVRDRVRLVGHRDDASELISAADMFVMPSRAEALCQALLEAMHQGVCPVVSDAGGMKEVVRHEHDGLVFPSQDVAALAGVIRRLHADRGLGARYAAAARNRVATEFTPERMAERCMSLYRDVLSCRSALQAA
jgi:glycosyltransferase involved in cell wall biosynthesis